MQIHHTSLINMFSGIVEATGRVERVEKEKGNLHLSLSCPFTEELSIDQSIAHNGVCLTVVKKSKEDYTVTAIEETLKKSNLGLLREGSLVNLERSLRINDRLDGHIVQGHVDQTAVCTEVQSMDGSWVFSFEYTPSRDQVTVEKGSICVNGVSLTVVNSRQNSFQVAIIPYTFLHTNFHKIKKGTVVNLEFDILGKYIARLLELQK